MVNDGRTHPEDLELLDFVEGDLPRTRANEVAAHVERCTLCERAVQELQAGRAATHTAARLELSSRARDRITEAIGRERQHPRKAVFDRLRPLTAVFAAVVVLGSLAGVVALVTRSGGGGDDAGEVAASGGGETAGSADRGAAPEVDDAGIASVAGPPRAVARALRGDGFDARVSGSTVIVTGTTLEAVQESLSDRAAGPVRVVVRP